ncbi:hypothetical protein N7520_005924 [Penicillium odoratum]|uniref:uncharacterized protein n=1 Tax=Penicillium odoratum TaxID=1167516 RepID=UPI0025479B3B|nr:uncharacterized protein N7520_005924 [Penicillium odoratum]KAJ5758768.1 hypothetical protein N7520_005924 [Penicillium odoratum]
MLGATNIAASGAGGGGGKPSKKPGKTPADKVAELVNRKTPEALAVLKKALKAYQTSVGSLQDASSSPLSGGSKPEGDLRVYRVGRLTSYLRKAANHILELKISAKAKATALSEPAYITNDKATFNAAIPNAAKGPVKRQSKGQLKGTEQEAADLITFPMLEMLIAQPPEEEWLIEFSDSE